jgi:hypothetical protein
MLRKLYGLQHSISVSELYMYPSVVVGYSIARNIYSSLWWDGYMLE